MKHKRKRNLIKKAIELSVVMDMDIYMVLRDRDTGKYSQYTSATQSGGLFTIDKV